MATDKSVSIHVEGLRELQRDLKAEPERLDKDLRRELKSAAAEVADEAKAAASSLGAPRPGGAVVRSIRPSSSSTDARVSLGGPAVPWAMGAEFGSDKYHQFRPWAGRSGYFFYPAIRKAQEETLPQRIDGILEEFRRRMAPG